MNDGKWIKPTGATFSPSCFVSVVVQTEPTTHDKFNDLVIHEFHSVHVVESRRRMGKWSEPIYQQFFSGNVFFDWLESFGSIRRRTYVVTPIASNSLTLCGFWDRITERGAILQRRGEDGRIENRVPIQENSRNKCQTDRPDVKVSSSALDPSIYYFNGLILSGKPDIVKYRINGRSFAWVSAGQYFVSSEESIARSLGYKWPVSGELNDSSDTVLRTSSERAFLWLRAFQTLADWWQDIDGGPWGMTVASMSMNFLRHRIGKQEILKHDNDTVKLLEESAIFGGRRSLWFYGNIGTTDDWQKLGSQRPPRSTYPEIRKSITHIDVRSMYPWILSSMAFPVKLLAHYNCGNASDLADMLKKHGVIARVRIKTDVPEFPYRTGENTTYPIGEITTTLCGPELQSAIDAGMIQHVYSWSCYQLGTPFRKSALELLKYRLDAKRSENKAWEMYVKHLSNAMAGKLAQRRHNWIERVDKPAQVEWGFWTEIDATTGAHKVYRAIAGMVWERVDVSTPDRPMSAAFAYLTSYGRYIMRTVRALAPSHNVLSQDTDGIWILDNALSNMPIDSQGLEGIPGDLRITYQSMIGRFFSPQHYWTQLGWTLAGFNRPFVEEGSATIHYSESSSYIAGATTIPKRRIYEKENVSYLHKITKEGNIAENGWLVPQYILETRID
jgi:hypothetical protein